MSTHYLMQVHNRSADIVAQSVEQPAETGAALQSIADIAKWRDVLAAQREAQLIEYVTNQMQVSLYLASAGFYRQAFATLRLALEMTFGMIYFSTNLLELREWMAGEKDINWRSLTDDETGVLSRKFQRAFFPHELADFDDFKSFAATARTLYRQLSQEVHGNRTSWDARPVNLRFDADFYSQIIQNIGTITQLFHFCAFGLAIFTEFGLPPSRRGATPKSGGRNNKKPFAEALYGIRRKL